jgi:hypothetical protein
MLPGLLKAKGRDLAPAPIKPAFFGIEITSVLGPGNFRFLEGCRYVPGSSQKAQLLTGTGMEPFGGKFLPFEGLWAGN